MTEDWVSLDTYLVCFGSNVSTEIGLDCRRRPTLWNRCFCILQSPHWNLFWNEIKMLGKHYHYIIITTHYFKSACLQYLYFIMARQIRQYCEKNKKNMSKKKWYEKEEKKKYEEKKSGTRRRKKWFEKNKTSMSKKYCLVWRTIFAIQDNIAIKIKNMSMSEELHLDVWKKHIDVKKKMC